MKKISLKNLNLNEVDQLSREQLKNVLGGYTFGTTGTDGSIITSETETTNYACECSDYCFVSMFNNPSEDEIHDACESCCSNGS